MCAKWRSEYNPQLILDKVSPCVSVNSTGGLVCTDFDHILRYTPILISALEFCPDIPDSEKEALVKKGIQEAVRKGSLTTDTVRQTVSRAERDFLRRQSADFVLATSISFRKMPPFRKVVINGQTILFSKILPRQFERKDAEKRVRSLFAAPLPTDYIAVRVASTGRNQAEAARKALESLGLLMGIWNFLLTRGSVTFTLGGTGQGPIADLRLGPMHTLHHPDGQAATPLIWYEPAYTQPASAKDYSDRFMKMRKDERWIQNQITKADDGEWFRNAFMRYAAAVDEPRLETAFLQFWSLFEHLTNTRKDSYEATVRRAAFIYEDYQFARQELQHLRGVRNGLVHLGQSSGDRQAHVFQLKRYVDDLLLFLLGERNIRQSLEEINELLDLPPDADELRRRCALQERAITFRKPKDAKK